MSESGDYTGEMLFNQSTDRDIERLFAGSHDPSGPLAPVADLFESMRAEATSSLNEATVAAVASSAATAVAERPAAAGAPVAGAATAGAGRGSLAATVRRRIAATAVAFTVLVGGMSGMAVAADDAKPGDALYGLDRALEAVGVGNGRAAERLAEVHALIEAGDVPRGLQHAAESVEHRGQGRSSASIALMEAADRVSSSGSERSAAVRAQVAGLLAYLSESAHEPDGEEIAGLARQIGRPDDLPNTPAATGRPDDPGSPGNSPAEPPGRSGRTPGPPVSPGNRP